MTDKKGFTSEFTSMLAAGDTYSIEDISDYLYNEHKLHFNQILAKAIDIVGEKYYAVILERSKSPQDLCERIFKEVLEHNEVDVKDMNFEDMVKWLGGRTGAAQEMHVIHS